jgi:uncharacterized protein YcbX
MTELGRVAALWRYPVKSMAGESLDEVEVSWHGLTGDRRWAFVQDGLERSGFPWLTIRERSDMWQYMPWFAEPSRPDSSRTLVRTPGGRELDVTDPALAEELAPGARVIKQNRGVFDVSPLSLTTTQSVAAVGELVGEALESRRFRPNLLIEAAGDDPFAEDDWVGAVLEIGEARMRVDLRDERCVMVNVDPATSERNAAVLKAIARERDACLGVYGSIVTPGRIAVGDPVRLAA